MSLLGRSSIFPQTERVVSVNLGITWDTGAPLPHVVQSELRAFLIFQLPHEDPEWDGSYVRLVDPASAKPEQIGIIEWKGCRGAVLGGLNDESIHGHRLWKYGLSDIIHAGGEVLNSRWVAELEEANRVHPYHDPQSYRSLRHYILLFHDSMFECIAESFVVDTVWRPMPRVLQDMVARVTQSAP